MGKALRWVGKTIIIQLFDSLQICFNVKPETLNQAIRNIEGASMLVLWVLSVLRPTAAIPVGYRGERKST